MSNISVQEHELREIADVLESFNSYYEKITGGNVGFDFTARVTDCNEEILGTFAYDNSAERYVFYSD